MLEKISGRRTAKVIGDINRPYITPDARRHRVDNMLNAAGNAPFHYACDRIHTGTNASPVPWRSYALDNAATNSLMNHLMDTGDTTKVPNMLAAAEFLVQVTWLPDADTIIGDGSGKLEPAFVGTLRNMEHIAAGAAFIQSLLLAAEDAGFKTYWSSGGPLRTNAVFGFLGIPTTQLLLGSVFLFPANPEDAEIKPGSLVTKRGALADWSRWCDLG